jgi:hypothetical protein
MEETVAELVLLESDELLFAKVNALGAIKVV